jgi:adenine phosphoribosyltransferase
LDDLRRFIRDVPDFPKPGIIFRDLTPLLADAAALRRAVEALAEPFRGDRIDTVVGIDSRGFIVGTPVALELGAGFVPVRKKGKLPHDTIEASYDLEYGTDSVEMHVDAVAPGRRVLLVDDLIATGGTAAAALELLRRSGAEIVGCAFLMELKALGGRDRLKHDRIHVLIDY